MKQDEGRVESGWAGPDREWRVNLAIRVDTNPHSRATQICTSRFTGEDLSSTIGLAGVCPRVRGKISPYPEVSSSCLPTRIGGSVCLLQRRLGLGCHLFKATLGISCPRFPTSKHSPALTPD